MTHIDLGPHADPWHRYAVSSTDWTVATWSPERARELVELWHG